MYDKNIKKAYKHVSKEQSDIVKTLKDNYESVLRKTDYIRDDIHKITKEVKSRKNIPTVRSRDKPAFSKTFEYVVCIKF